MTKVKFELNRAGVANLMKTSGMQKILSNHATAIKKRSGPGYEQDIHVGRNRANARVWAETKDAKNDNLDNNTLLKSVK